MISQLSGELVAFNHEDNLAEVRDGFVTLAVLVPAADGQRIVTLIGKPVHFHTLFYLEGQGQGTSFAPRLIGFASAAQREFFELFTTVKGIGYRKALRAMQLPFGTIAAAIAGKDRDLLVSLPEIGKRTAETIIAELSGKVDRFIELKPTAGLGDIDRASPAARLAADAVAALVQLGETRLRAMQLVDRTLAADPTLATAEELISGAYRLRDLP
jgi:holliday junction DNA helicase RuvA